MQRLIVNIKAQRVHTTLLKHGSPLLGQMNTATMLPAPSKNVTL